jgi:hydroxymethylglutaryl-CoA lyase
MPSFATPPSFVKSACATACKALRARCPPRRSASGFARRHAAGQREIEVGSFVPARLLPQLADTAELVAFAKTLPGLVVSVLVPNLRGAQSAMESGAHAMMRAAVCQPCAQPG